MKPISLLFFAFILTTRLWSQNEVLLTIDNQPILRSEFERIYHKNSNIEGYENKPPAEYLDMFINFKLKVAEAKKLGLDTLPSFTNELSGYREQLSKPYLQDRKLIDQLLQEAYYRTVHEVNASHVMVRLNANATPDDTLKAYNKALEIRQRILDGESFDKIAREESDDPSGRNNSGRLGWFSAFTMVYPFENAAYNTKVGGYSMPVKSRYGYHIIRVNAVRPALGEIKLAHIMVRADLKDDQASLAKKEKIDACYKALQGGSSFAEMVKQYSEDAGTSRTNGQMRWLRSGELPVEIEQLVFSLKDSGSITGPLTSEYGWHIFQLQGKRPIASFDQLKSQLEEKVMMDERGKRTEEVFINMLKREYDFIKYPENVTMIADLMDSSVYAGNWNPEMAQNLIEPVFAISNKEFSQKDLVDFIIKTRRYNKNDTYQSIVERKLDQLVSEELLKYEKRQLEEKHPAFRYLMEEYHDGILLFNIMDSKVWSKAVSDTSGLLEFYNQHANKYVWGERADVSVYTLEDPALVKPVLKLAKKRSKIKSPASELINKLCSADSVPCVIISDEKFEKEDTQPLQGFIWKKGYNKTMNEGDKTKILVVNGILPPETKTFNETQGQVTADYQNFLDQQWIDSLRAKYNISVNRDVLQLVK